jgi:hypothetical protein
MSPRRAGYREYLGWLDLTDLPRPMEILVRTGGGRVTDTFHVVGSFLEHDGKRQGKFFASGISHIADADSRLKQLTVGDLLELRDDPGNPADPRAILLDARGGGKVGWVPNWLLDEVHGRRTPDSALTVRVARVNLDAPAHLKLLRHLEAVRH